MKEGAVKEPTGEDKTDAVHRAVEDYLDLRYLKYFVVVAESGSFTRAAERLNTVQPSISRQIKRLEEIVGTPLFRRSTHEIALTPAGEVFLEEAKGLLKQVQNGIRRAQETASRLEGNLEIGVMQGTERLFFRDMLRPVQTRIPEVAISVLSMTEQLLLQRLKDGTLDLAFLSGPIDDLALESVRVVAQPLLAAIPADHPLAAKATLDLTELEFLPIIRPHLQSAPHYNATLDRVAQQAGVHFRSASAFCDSPLAALQMVGSGLGFCLIVEAQVDYLPLGTVVRPLAAAGAAEAELYLIWSRLGASRWVRKFVSLVAANRAGSGKIC